MRATIGRGRGAAPLILTAKDLQILRFLATVNVATAGQVAAALFTEGSLTTVRSRLSTLAGGGDYVPNGVLLRLPVPSRTGNPQRAYCLGAEGRAILEHELGSRGTKHTPSKLRVVSYHTLRHTLALSGLYACLLRWDRSGQASWRLRKCQLSYELTGNPTLPVVPDMFLVVEGARRTRARWIEVDASTQWRKAWVKRCQDRLIFTPSDAYQAAFGKGRPLLCYLALGETPEAGERRAKTLARWALALCKDLGQEHYARRLRFTGATLQTLLQIGLFEDKPLWVRPDQPATLLPLFPSHSTEEH